MEEKQSTTNNYEENRLAGHSRASFEQVHPDKEKEVALPLGAPTVNGAGVPVKPKDSPNNR